MTANPTDRHGDVVDELDTWLDSNWDPDLSVGEWWECLGLAGWSAPSLPEHAYGRALSRNDALRVAQAIAEFGALGAPGGLGLLLAAPTIATHGSQEQIDLYVRDIVTGQRGMVPAVLRTSGRFRPRRTADAGDRRRRRVDRERSEGLDIRWPDRRPRHADRSHRLRRSEAPGHHATSRSTCTSQASRSRPLRELTGRALFNEVFLSDARVRGDAMIGGRNKGWAVANTTLAFERAGLGSGGGHAAGSTATPGTVVGDLGRRAGDFVSGKRGRPQGGAQFRGAGRMLIELARATGSLDDPLIRQDLMRLHTLAEIGRMSTLRLKAVKVSGGDIAGIGNIGKLSMSDMMRLQRDLGLRLLGASGTLHAYDSASRESLDAATGQPMNAVVTEMALFAQAPPIYGGTDQIQKNIIGERVLGLPKEPNNDRTVPFVELPKNA